MYFQKDNSQIWVSKEFGTTHLGGFNEKVNCRDALLHLLELVFGQRQLNEMVNDHAPKVGFGERTNACIHFKICNLKEASFGVRTN